MEKKTGIISIISIIAVLLGVISIIALKNMETQPEPKKEYTTTININGTDIKLGITEEELKEIFPEETYTACADNGFGLVNEKARLAERLTDYKSDNMVLGKNTMVFYLFGWNDTDGLDLREICIEYKDEIEPEITITELETMYGEYKKSWWASTSVLRESYRWDMEDGTSIVYQVAYGGTYKMICMIATEYINEEKFYDTYEEAKNNM